MATKRYIVQVYRLGQWQDWSSLGSLEEAEKLVMAFGRARIVEVTRRVVLLKEE